MIKIEHTQEPDIFKRPLHCPGRSHFLFTPAKVLCRQGRDSDGASGCGGHPGRHKDTE
jgi:hypothetical protein